VIVLALGLGANTAIFSVVDAFLLRNLPYKDPSQLVALFERDPVGPIGSDPYNSVAAGNFLDWQRLSKSFEQIAAAQGTDFNLTSLDKTLAPERIHGCLCSSNTFSTLGIAPALGPGFRADEDRWGAPHVAVISYAFWQRHFGGAEDVIHRQIRLDGANYEIVGVMPRGFAFPDRRTEIWTPLLAALTPEQQRTHDMHGLFVIGRLRPGVSVGQA
jgi:hypothetical protein